MLSLWYAEEIQSHQVFSPLAFRGMEKIEMKEEGVTIQSQGQRKGNGSHQDSEGRRPGLQFSMDTHEFI